jgi:hypothetical protein
MKLLIYNPEERFSAKQALSHPHFKDLVEQEAKMTKLSTHNFNSILIKSFHNDSQSMIKSTEETQLVNNLITKRGKEKSYLPEIKVNIIIDNKKNDSYDSDASGSDVFIFLSRMSISNCQR